MAYLSLFIFVILVFIAASTGSLFKPGAWYASLRKPSWTPPNWMFPVVWSLLYICIAFAGWFVWEEQGLGLLLFLWGLQLVLNMAWSYIFFGKQKMFLGLIDIVLLWGVVLSFIIFSYSTVPMAAYLFMPYLIWLTIAAFLNFDIFRKNA